MARFVAVYTGTPGAHRPAGSGRSVTTVLPRNTLGPGATATLRVPTVHGDPCCHPHRCCMSLQTCKTNGCPAPSIQYPRHQASAHDGIDSPARPLRVMTRANVRSVSATPMSPAPVAAREGQQRPFGDGIL